MVYNRIGVGSMKPIIIGVAGGTGSGKTTVSQAILERVGRELITYIQHDSYYKDLSHLPPQERARVNYDHPQALENELLVEHLRQLQAGWLVEVPIYDFTTHTRKGETRRAEPRSVILVEGILIFADKALRDLMDIKIFVDTDPDIRFIRRLQRDIAERGRTRDIIIPEGGFNVTAIDMVVARVEAMVGATPL